jgi:hypothetical protein
MDDCCGLDDDDLSSDSFPLMYSLIDHEQQKDEILLAQAQKDEHYSLKKFHGGGNAVNNANLFQKQDCHTKKSKETYNTMVSLSIVPSRH